MTAAGDEAIVPDGLDATLVLLRHGETEYIAEGRFQGRAETPLTALGRRQAALAGDRLAHPTRSPALPVPSGPPREIVHSPLRRTRQTAVAAADAMAEPGAFGVEVPVRADSGLFEIAQGAWEGLRHDEILERYAAELAGWRRRPTELWAPGGEPLTDVRARVRPMLRTVLTTLADGRAAGTLDRSQVSGYRASSLADDRPWSILVGHDGVFKVLLLTLLDLPLERFWSFSFGLCAISVVEIRAGRPVLVAMNLTDHLAPLQEETSAAREQTAERQRAGAL
ncbi:MAG TPA: histidine phosphatase family protein [Candidatus Dormibacteraeota bacterium]|nr:histidine phosphatase family protein [Candidatus Dormibacteraeota bacterium]